MNGNANRDANLGERGDGGPGTESLLEIARNNPGTSATLAISIIVGMVIGIWFVEGDWSLFRRVAGGALAGGGCWLLVMMGRILG